MPLNRSLDRDQFLALLADRFPEVIKTFDEIDNGLIHLEVAAFRRCVENAMDAEQMWDVEKYLAFVNDVLPQSTSSLENALEVSFIEDFALGDINENRRRAIRERSPETIRNKIIEVNNDWR